MQGPDYLFSFSDKNYNFYQVINEVVSIATAPDSYFLESSPIGWDDLTVVNQRNTRLWGLDRQVSASLSFVNDGALILKDTFYRKGTEADCYLSIAKQELSYQPGVGYGYWYRQIFRGAVDFSTFVHDGPKVTCRTLEDGLPKYIKANENTIYEFPMNVADAVQVKFDGIRLHNKVTYGLIGIADAGGILTGYKNLGTVPIQLSVQEGDGYGLEYLPVSPEAIGDFGTDITSYMINSDNWCAMNTGTIPVTFPLEGLRKFRCDITNQSPIADDIFDMYFIKSDGTQYNIFTGLSMTNGQDYSYSYTFSITLNPGEKLFSIRWFHRSGGGPSSSAITYSEDSYDIISAITRRPATYVPHFTGQYLLDQLINKVTDGAYTADTSPVLLTDNNVLFTCGNAIRGITDNSGTPNAVMQLSLATFFQFFDCRWSVGIMERLGKVLFDTKGGLVDITNFIDLGIPAYQPTIAVDGDYPFNEIEIGYPEIRNDVGALNGNEEFNCTYRFTLGTVVKPAKIEKISKIKASCYEQEKIRTTLFSKNTTDFKNDNDVYANYVDGTLQPSGTGFPAHYLLDRSLNTGATGLIEPGSIWNLRLSPKRHLNNNGSFLRSSMYECDNLTLKFVSADKNSKVVAGGLTENADVLMGNFNAPFFKPLIYNIGVRAPEDLISLLEINPLQVYRFYFQGQYWYGIANKVSINPSNKKEQQYELLAVPTNNFTDLIKYFG